MTDCSVLLLRNRILPSIFFIIIEYESFFNGELKYFLTDETKRGEGAALARLAKVHIFS